MVDAVTGAIVGAGILWMLMILAFFGLIIGIFVFWVMMLVDAIKRDFPKPDDRLIWILVIVLVGFIGALIYYFVIKRKG